MCERLLEAFLCSDLEWNVCLPRNDCELKTVNTKRSQRSKLQINKGRGRGREMGIEPRSLPPHAWQTLYYGDAFPV